MCGIVGVISFQRCAWEAEEPLQHLVDLMSHRGPDDMGLWSDGVGCALGFRRLSILDLSPAGHQPMVTEDGRYALVFNGEVYNFRELRRQLELEGVRFRSTGDTEVVLYALAHWDTGALARFNGMFALGFLDTVERRLLLARDHAGIKPLYYLRTPRGLVFGSQYDQILAHPWSRSLKISPDALALYLRLGYIPAPYALLQNTQMLEPGSWMRAMADGQVEQGRFFAFPLSPEPDLRGEEAYEAVDAAITAAVRRQLVSDVRLGTFLSGGIDSPLVAAKANAARDDPALAFTLGTNGGWLDESADAATYAREIGLEHQIEHVTPNQALAMLADVVASCSEPFADSSVFSTMMIARLARQRVKVMLSGDGGDELFWGYAGRFASVLRRAEEFRQTSWLRTARWGAKRLLNIGNAEWNLRWPTIGDWYRAKHTRTPEGWLRRIFPEVPKWPEEFALFDYSRSGMDQTAAWLRWNELVGHLTMVLLKVDRASMYHSLEVRVPLLDREVVEVATRVDWRSCLNVEREIGKIPLRRALARHVRHQTTRKRGFGVPMGDWLRGPLRSIFEEAVLERREMLGLSIDQAALREMFRRHLAGQVDYSGSLWLLLSLSLWEERHYRANCHAGADRGTALLSMR
jgi:asparagine synthase (glutamine-hydrolysing)